MSQEINISGNNKRRNAGNKSQSVWKERNMHVLAAKLNTKGGSSEVESTENRKQDKKREKKQ
jgi:hypothetical protein